MPGSHSTDAKLLSEINQAITSKDEASIVRLLRAYYGDLDRADRTERAALYLHLGVALGMTEKLLREKRNRTIES